MSSNELADMRRELDAMRTELNYHNDRRAIQDVVYRYSRAVDRHDVDMIRTVFWPDAIDNHGIFIGDVDDFIKWVNGGHEAKYRAHLHSITCHSCELKGDVAHTESYVLFILHTIDATRVHIGGGRYIDRMEKRNGEWRIALRRVIVDWRCSADGGWWNQMSQNYPTGQWDKQDISYMRPLELTPELKKQFAERKKA